MIEDVSREVSQEAVPAEASPRMDRRSFLLALSGGALALTATSLLAGCGGGGGGGGGSTSSSSASAAPSAQQFTGALPLPSGQTGALAMVVTPAGQASGTLTVGAAPALKAAPHTAISIPAGFYVITGTIDPTTGAFNLSTTSGLLNVTGTLPTQTAAGTYTLTNAGTTSPAVSIPAGAFTVGNLSSATIPVTTTGTAGQSPSQVNGASATRTTISLNGTSVATVDAQVGFPAFTLAAVPATALPSGLLPSGTTVRTQDGFIIALTLNGTPPVSATPLYANVTPHYVYSGTNPVISYTSDGIHAAVPAANYGVSNNNEAVPIVFQNGALSTIAGTAGTGSSASTVTAPATTYGTTVFVGLFAQ